MAGRHSAEAGRVHDPMAGRGAGVWRRQEKARRVARFAVTPLIAAVLSFYSGLISGGSDIVIDNCYVAYDEWERPKYSCDGHWTRLGQSVEGPVRGYDPSDLTARFIEQPTAPATTVDGRWFLAVPASERNRAGFAGRSAAIVTSTVFVVAADIVAVLLLAGWLVALGRLVQDKRRPRSGAEP